MQKLVTHLQAALRSGPIAADELMEFLEQRGLRRVEPGDIFLTCTEHGLADLSDGRWIPRGWATANDSSADAPEGVPRVGTTTSGAPRLSGDRSPELVPQLSGAHQVELKQLRTQVVPEVTATPRSIEHLEVPAEWTRFVDEAVEGLRDELTAVSQQRTLSEIPLRGGTVRERGATRQVVRFEADSEPTVKDGMPATLVLRTGIHEVEVISIYGVMVTLAVPTQALVEERATLRSDLSYLTSYQAGRLRELRRPQEDFDVRAALDVLRPSLNEPERAEPYWVDGLNEQQSQAVGQALTEGTTWIWGPPGTGKTTTLAALLTELYTGRRRILLTGPTNTAVDVALEAVLRQVGDYELGSIVRVGQPALPTLRHLQTPVLANELVDLRSAPLQKSQDDASEDLESLRARHKEMSRADGDAPEMRSIEVRIAEHQAFQRELDRIRADARRAVAANARLVAATAHQTLLTTLKGQTFDVVVIDEASMLPASLAALAAGAGRGHTIVAGDFRQLPPVVVSEEPNARRWLGRSAFEAAGIDQRVLRGDPPTNLVALKLQHRMPPRLAHAVTAGFYRENPLESAPNVWERRDAGLSSWGPIVRIDTSSLRPRVAKRGGTGSRYNLMHAILIASVLSNRELAGPAPALISPFAPQARLLEALVPEGGAEGEASTVHRFQGGERDVVIVDAVESAAGALKLHPWFADGDDGTSGARLVNVAASRARERLILVADFDRVHRSRGREDALARFFRVVQSESDALQPGEVVAPEVLFRQPDLVTFSSDVESAQHRLEIWSQRVDEGVMVDLIRPLLGAASRGVQVTLWFEPDGQTDVPVALKSLQRSEVILRPCRPIRESSAVVDDTVWAASGPLLSGAAGHTMRLENSPLAEAVRRMTRRRELGGSAATGEDAGTCGRCGRLLTRIEARSVMAGCLSCDAPRSGGRQKSRRTT